jgi:acetyl-CoA carboxylase biotin carboxyl carrier protein
MEIEKIKELMDMMKANDLNELEIVDGQTRIMLKRGSSHQVIPQVVAMPPVVSAVLPAETALQASGKSNGVPSASSAEDNLVEIVSPIVGTFYIRPSPTAEQFVDVGSQVDEETVVCIIEAMKVMNEIKSEIKGTIKKILVSNGQSLEYGQPMFLVEPG